MLLRLVRNLFVLTIRMEFLMDGRYMMIVLLLLEVHYKILVVIIIVLMKLLKILVRGDISEKEKSINNFINYNYCFDNWCDITY